MRWGGRQRRSGQSGWREPARSPHSLRQRQQTAQKLQPMCDDLMPAVLRWQRFQARGSADSKPSTQITAGFFSMPRSPGCFAANLGPSGNVGSPACAAAEPPDPTWTTSKAMPILWHAFTTFPFPRRRYLFPATGPGRFAPTANSSIQSFWGCGNRPGPK